MGKDVLFQELTSIEKGGKNENYRVVSPESVHIYFKICTKGCVFKTTLILYIAIWGLLLHVPTYNAM